MNILIKNGTIVNEGLSFKGSLLIEDDRISQIIKESVASGEEIKQIYLNKKIDKVINASGMYILPGVIDDQVHFREPGSMEKATIESESRAAVLGGVTSFMDMPNNNPPAVTNAALEKKFGIAAESSYANYSFYLGATDENIGEIKAVNKQRVCGVKVFMGSSTGNMLVNSTEALQAIFRESPVLIATHCEQEEIIQANLEMFKNKYGEDIPFESHPDIRSRQACIACSERAIQLATANNSRLHILHISTAEELDMIRQAQKINPKITGEVCVHYMWFNRGDYTHYGSKIKCNPAIKEESDMLAIRKAVKEGLIKVVATDHAPHLKEEKANKYLKAPSGLPLVQHSLQLMLELVKKEVLTIEEVAARMSHGPAECFRIKERGFIREGYFADLVIIHRDLPDNKSPLHPAYKCGWSPFAGYTFGSSIVHTLVNGSHVVENGRIQGERKVQALVFER